MIWNDMKAKLEKRRKMTGSWDRNGELDLNGNVLRDEAVRDEKELYSQEHHEGSRSLYADSTVHKKARKRRSCGKEKTKRLLLSRNEADSGEKTQGKDGSLSTSEEHDESSLQEPRDIIDGGVMNVCGLCLPYICRNDLLYFPVNYLFGALLKIGKRSDLVVSDAVIAYDDEWNRLEHILAEVLDKRVDRLSLRMLITCSRVYEICTKAEDFVNETKDSVIPHGLEMEKDISVGVPSPDPEYHNTEDSNLCSKAISDSCLTKVECKDSPQMFQSHCDVLDGTPDLTQMAIDSGKVEDTFSPGFRMWLDNFVEDIHKDDKIIKIQASDEKERGLTSDECRSQNGQPMYNSKNVACKSSYVCVRRQIFPSELPEEAAALPDGDLTEEYGETSTEDLKADFLNFSKRKIPALTGSTFRSDCARNREELQLDACDGNRCHALIKTRQFVQTSPCQEARQRRSRSSSQSASVMSVDGGTSPKLIQTDDECFILTTEDISRQIKQEIVDTVLENAPSPVRSKYTQREPILSQMMPSCFAEEGKAEWRLRQKDEGLFWINEKSGEERKVNFGETSPSSEGDLNVEGCTDQKADHFSFVDFLLDRAKLHHADKSMSERQSDCELSSTVSTCGDRSEESKELKPNRESDLQTENHNERNDVRPNLPDHNSRPVTFESVEPNDDNNDKPTASTSGEESAAKADNGFPQQKCTSSVERMFLALYGRDIFKHDVSRLLASKQEKAKIQVADRNKTNAPPYELDEIDGEVPLTGEKDFEALQGCSRISHAHPHKRRYLGPVGNRQFGRFLTADLPHEKQNTVQESSLTGNICVPTSTGLKQPHRRRQKSGKVVKPLEDGPIVCEKAVNGPMSVPSFSNTSKVPSTYASVLTNISSPHVNSTNLPAALKNINQKSGAISMSSVDISESSQRGVFSWWPISSAQSSFPMKDASNNGGEKPTQDFSVFNITRKDGAKKSGTQKRRFHSGSMQSTTNPNLYHAAGNNAGRLHHQLTSPTQGSIRLVPQSSSSAFLPSYPFNVTRHPNPHQHQQLPVRTDPLPTNTVNVRNDTLEGEISLMRQDDAPYHQYQHMSNETLRMETVARQPGVPVRTMHQATPHHDMTPPFFGTQRPQLRPNYTVGNYPYPPRLFSYGTYPGPPVNGIPYQRGPYPSYTGQHPLHPPPYWGTPYPQEARGIQGPPYPRNAMPRLMNPQGQVVTNQRHPTMVREDEPLDLVVHSRKGKDSGLSSE